MPENTKKTLSPIKGFFTFEKGSVKMILMMVFPILIELLLATAFGMVDHMMAGQYSTEALNAIGLYSTPSSIFNVAFTAVNVGTTVRVAWNIGAKKYSSARKVLMSSMKLNFLISIVITAACMFAAPYAIEFMAGGKYGSVHVAGTVASDAVDVFRICSAGLVFQALTSAITASLRGAGENRVPLVYNIASSFLNVVGNYIFIYGVGFLGIPEMGAQGAALSTSLCKIFAFIFALIFLCFSRNSRFSFRTAKYATDFDDDNGQDNQQTQKKKFSLLPDLDITKKIMEIGLPSALESMIIQIGFTLLAKMIVSTGPESYAAHQVTNSINSLFLMVGSAFSSAANTIVGQYVGAKDLRGVKYYVGAITKLSFIMSIVMSICIFLFSGGLVLLYTHDENVIGLATELLKICTLVVIFSNVLSVFSGALRGAGDTKYPVYVAIFSVLLLRVSLVFLVVNVFHWGIVGVWWVTTIDNFVRGVLMILRYKSGKWQKTLETSDI